MDSNTSSTLNVSDTLSISWKHFTQQWVPWVVSTAIVGGVAVAWYIVLLVWMLALSAQSQSDSPSYGYSSGTGAYSSSGSPSESSIVAFVIFMVISVIVMGVLFLVYSLNAYRQAYRQSQGQQITTGGFFSFSGLGKIFVVGLLCQLIVFVGFVLFIIPGFIASVVLIYALPAAAANPHDSIGTIFSKAYQAFKNNLGQSFLLWFVVTLISSLGGSFILAVLVTGPLYFLAFTIGYLMSERRSFVVPS